MNEQTERALFWWGIILSLTLFWVAIGYVLWPVMAEGSPFLTGTWPEGGACVSVQGIPGMEADRFCEETDGNYKIDVESIPDGTYPVTVTGHGLWDEEGPPSDPFSFTKPNPPAKPGAPTLGAE